MIAADRRRKWRGLAAAIAVALPTLPAASRQPDSARLPPLPPAVIDNDLAIGGEAIAANKLRSRMTVAVAVEGRGPYRFVVDSGADSSALGARVARTLRLVDAGPVTLHAMTASRRVDRVRVSELGLGPTTIRDLKLPVLDEEDLGADGMLGIDALVEQRLMMDFDKRVITVEDASRPAARLDGDIVVTARRRRGQLILTQVTASRQPVEAVIDTGSEITIGNTLLRDRLLRRTNKKLETVEVIGVTGASMHMQIARIAELKVGPIVLQDVPIAFADVPPFTLFGLNAQPAMMLGTDMMEKFRRVSLDFRARRVRFQLKRCGATSVRIGTGASMSRLSWRDTGGEPCRG